MMILLRSLLVTVFCIASLSVTPALAAPALEPSYYLPTQAEYPAGWAILSTTTQSEVEDTHIQGTIVLPHTGSAESIMTFVTVMSGGQIAKGYMANRRVSLAAQNGIAPSPSTVADESFVSVGMTTTLDHWTFAVRDGAVVVESELTSYHGSLTPAQAGQLVRSILDGTLARMHAHPYGQ